MNYEELACDVLVVGSGAAGCRAALAAAAAGARVLLADKGAIGLSGNSVMAEAAFNAPDPAAGHDLNTFATDTLLAGGGLGDPALVERLATEAHQRLADLVRWGCPVNRTPDGRVAYALLPASRQPVAAGYRTTTGKAVMQTLLRELRRQQVRTRSRLLITDLRQNGSGRVTGAAGWCLASGRPVRISTGAVVLATGGTSSAYAFHTNSRSLTGDGWALALQAGAVILDPDHQQFHVALLHPPVLRGAVISSLFLTAGAVLRNGAGEAFMARYWPGGEATAPRDAMALAVATEVAAGRGTPRGGVWMDLTGAPAEYWTGTFAGFRRDLITYGDIDPARQPVAVGMAAHYTTGGVRIGPSGETEVPGLFAAGEVAGGLHGQNRLGGNGLPESQVFGAAAGGAAAAWAHSTVGRRRAGAWPAAMKVATGGDAGETVCSLKAEASRELQAELGPWRGNSDLPGLAGRLRVVADAARRLAPVPGPPPCQRLAGAWELQATLAAASAAAAGANLRKAQAAPGWVAARLGSGGIRVDFQHATVSATGSAQQRLG